MIAYKIQMRGVTGWGDLKTSEDNGETYYVESFKTKEEAIEEINSIVEGLNESNHSNYRVVNFITPEEEIFYPLH